MKDGQEQILGSLNREDVGRPIFKRIRTKRIREQSWNFDFLGQLLRQAKDHFSIVSR
jgi:hypothetical protein